MNEEIARELESLSNELNIDECTYDVVRDRVQDIIFRHKTDGDTDIHTVRYLVNRGIELKRELAAYDDALAVMLAVLPESPDDPVINYHLGWLFSLRCDWARATGHFERALRSRSLSTDETVMAINQLAHAYAFLGKTEMIEQCERELLACLRQNKLDSNGLYYSYLQDLQSIVGTITGVQLKRSFLIEQRAETSAITVADLDEWILTVRGCVVIDNTGEEIEVHNNHTCSTDNCYTTLGSELGRLLLCIVRHFTSGVSREVVAEHLWYQSAREIKYVTKRVYELRERLGEIFAEPDQIVQTIPGGYKWNGEIPWVIVKQLYTVG